MAKKMSTKKKASAAVAGVLAVALAVGGAYAWTDYSQSARNTFKGTVAADVLLHDDFDGENKDVYVENTGDNAVFVRVKFAEYLQIGNNSVLESPVALEDGSGLDLDGDGVADDEYLEKTKAQPDNVATWPVHQFINALAENDCGSTTHSYFEWNMSGLQKAYLSGVTEASSNGYGGLTEAQFEALTIGAPVSIGDITTKKMESAADSEIMMLTDWLALDTKPTNACWLLDSDGWAYWSHALAPDSATNLLLDAVQRAENSAPYDNWVYNIDVQLQAATVNELDYWYADGVADAASADNSVATVTANGLAFIKLRAGDAISSADGTVMGQDGTRYVSVGNNVYGVAVMNADGTAFEADPDQPLTLAGQDGILGSDDDNKLAGRIDANDDSVAIDVESINITDMTYKIAGVTDIIVNAGIDKQLGTYDDVLTTDTNVATTAVLGKYEIDGNTSDTEYVGWNYLGGPINNMLVATEYVLDNVQFNTSNSYGNDYVADDGTASAIKTKIDDIGQELITNGMEYVVEDSTVSMEKCSSNYVYICTNTAHTKDEDHQSGCTYSYAPYYTSSKNTTPITATFFALSIDEVLEAYGDATDVATRRLRKVPAAPAYVHSIPGGGGNGLNHNDSTSWKDDNGDPIVTTHYWLRSPGYTSTHAASLYHDGNVGVHCTVSNNRTGARPACYLNLSDATTTP